MRMSMHSAARPPSWLGNKIENLARTVALHFMYYNFGRIHSDVRMTPAMAAGISDPICRSNT